MRRGVLRAAATGDVIAADARFTAAPLRLLLGLIGAPAIPPDYALGLVGCDWVHTFGVRFPLDVVYCDNEGRVLRVVDDLPPGKIAPRAPGAAIAWEMRAGTVAGRLKPGDAVAWDPTDAAG